MYLIETEQGMVKFITSTEVVPQLIMVSPLHDSHETLTSTIVIIINHIPKFARSYNT